MVTPLRFAGLLLVTTALTASAAWAQDMDAAQTMDGASEAADAPEQATEVSIPGGGDIIVTGRRGGNVERAAPAVVSLLSAEAIARTGEGDIAGALGRVTGLSVVGNGYVYVRGLGDRYSLALLNGSPLPSPEPLKRVIPLDLFPTSLVASSLVQKSYSANFPGEFGGGVINLTTRAIPYESFVSVSGGIGLNSETTGRLGYTYYGSDTDWTGFDNGTRNTPPALAEFFASGAKISDVGVDRAAIIGQIATPQNALVQRNFNMPPSGSVSLSAGTSMDLGGSTLGVIASAGWSSKWRTRDILQQSAASLDLAQLGRDFQTVSTDNRVVVNGMLGFGLEFGDQKLRWTNLYIRDTIKQARLSSGQIAASGDFDFLNQDTAWYERQLINTQLVGELRFGDLQVDLRGSYANSQREAPFELGFTYVRTNTPTDVDPLGEYYINRLSGQVGTANFTFSDLNEDLVSGGIDVSYPLLPTVRATVGYAYMKTVRTSERRDFRIQAPGDFPAGIGLLRPDYLLSGNLADYFGYQLFETTETDPAFRARLKVHGAYGQIQATLMDGLDLNAGVRYERGYESVRPVQVFTIPSNSNASTALKKEYWLPTATVTYAFGDMQVRANASKTIARPQFRELIFQSYYDPESNTSFQGNPLLEDSELFNAEVRYEWYFARDQRVSLAGFYKKIDRPIETYISPVGDNSFTTSFANAPKADLYGAEFETQKYWSLGDMAPDHRLVTILNYTYSKSKLKVSASDQVQIFGVPPQAATNVFRDGAPLTGQSDHLLNLQIGLEDTSRLSQQTLLINYASERVTRRGLSGQPDIVEEPGFTLDFVARQGILLGSIESELKLEVRNITGTKYQEYQDNGTNRVYYNQYKPGTTFEASFSVTF
ncbi:MAG: TonB-dependent receptor plug domain-containing protein [Alphaproteobacteria bacterium]|nr:TonB-dependent receptor plug domain-containing protein [Alphaproteobacteria bacterium]MBU0794931.1 TonB-dependent receptor plug domain-containing protein [Alphaproteobacteria bacterium]MBU0875924.1 TonB-dependent receptor plug domain-containing protein [Alphaproteobacteria bacterium]MBU1770866.1 TonB-dependent receptor plug domain-containing protein [Alphaproteobacteria bacterium]